MINFFECNLYLAILIAIGKVNIGKHSAIALGIIIMDRINIGEDTVVGSESLVTKDLPDNVLAYGSPAKIIRDRELGEKFLKSN